jgi:putative DNA primase/helicase
MQHDNAPKSITDALQTIEQNDAAKHPARLRLVCAADVEPERVSWLWPEWLPFGKLVCLDGVASVGKSTLVTDLIARASRGGPMPYSDLSFAPISVLMAGVEDGYGDTIVPRLLAANADLSRVQFVQPQSAGVFTIPRDVCELMRRARESGATWLHIDAIMGTFGEDTNTNNDAQVRRALTPLKDAAAESGMLVTYIRHPRKAGGLAVNAGGGSVAFTALSRIGLFVGYHPEDKDKPSNQQRRVLATAKNNISQFPASIVFDVVNSPLGNGAGSIAWGGKTVVTADELACPPPLTPIRAAAVPKSEPRAPERTWILGQLVDGKRVKLDDLKALARDAGLSWPRVARAAEDEGVSKERVRAFPAFTEWYIPTIQSEQ